MASSKRRSDNSIREKLFNEFYEYSFFQAVKLLGRFFSDKKIPGKTLSPRDEVVRFSVKPGYAFPPSDIAHLSQKEKDQPCEMEITFMGAIGPFGILPTWYNELAFQRLRKKDKSFVDFLNIFHHRLVSYFYHAWKKYRVTENYKPGGQDRFSGFIMSLLGLKTPGLLDDKKFTIPRELLIYYSGLLSRAVPCVSALESTVEFFSSTSVHVEQFIERKLPLEPEDLTRIGQANGELGISAVCGSYVWERQSKFRLHLGPMDYDDFIRFLPSGDMLKPVISLIKYIVGIEYEFEIRLILKRKQVPLCKMGETSPQSPRLGWSTWTRTPEIFHDHHPYVTLQVNV